MVEEDEGIIIRSSKKQKQKKVPQRGLGVAQLEKIRLEEQQQKKDVINLGPKYHSSNSDMSSISSPNSILKPQSVHIFDSTTSVPLANLDWQSVSGHDHIMPKLWNLEKEVNYGVDPGLAFRSSFNLPYESNSTWPLHNLMQRSEYQPPTQMINVSSASSSTSSLNLHMELPSNQNYCSNHTPLWPEEDKMVGTKRPYPFYVENPAFHCKFPTVVNPIGRSDESTSFGHATTFNLIPYFRECNSYSDSVVEPNSKKNSIKENWDSNGDFLTLAPPLTTTLSSPNSKLKRPSAYQNETFDFNSLPYQGNVKDLMVEAQANVPDQLQPYFSFLPPAIIQIGHQLSATSLKIGEVGENVDLSLKL
ncbi:uncharacterized protein LOC126667264 [Mercurialis annua]|uniref:uncharacterized protein LOC126667264 n=1 Tax=Mercurialis annua TaxID=3986 RepID=UPI00215FA165|nr:uncharacterized protein LOC126667264 [Mercurialis annua]